MQGLRCCETVLLNQSDWQYRSAILIGYAKAAPRGLQCVALQVQRLGAVRLGRTLVHLVNITQQLSARGVGRQGFTGQGTQIDTSAR